MSSSSVKGLLKGLRYISHIFENEKKEEMVIGLPTDVKHVAHIGNDGPTSSSSTPSWSPRRRSSSKLGAESPSRATLASPGRTHKSSSSPGREVMDAENPRHYKQAGSESPGRIKQSNLESPRRSSPKFGSESPSRDTFASPKPTRRKKKTASSGEGARSKSKSTELQN
ncbi:hypothetical protein DCAR_0728037 [Daucus carota subsp. sativus]|uniref:CRIB domain-containing protein n=1 Tax=Daucus carota subsp. sativus TaxID=79200 RepID=A0AAF0XIH1_DAUCS|nr:hypothetical protein DCAR_0728037 [Daucus carota subsp. sativus]